MGVLLYQSASAVERSQVTGDKAALIRSLNKIRIYFTVSGVVAIIGLAVAVVAMILGAFGAIFEILSEYS